MEPTTPSIAEIILEQLGGPGRVAAMTGARMFAGNKDLTLVFPRKVGPRHCRITHLRVELDEAVDLYTIRVYRFNSRTLECPAVGAVSHISASNLRVVCESFTDLRFSL